MAPMLPVFVAAVVQHSQSAADTDSHIAAVDYSTVPMQPHLDRFVVVALK